MYYFIQEKLFFIMAKLGGDAQQQQPDFTVSSLFFVFLNSMTASAYM
jgi:hypothetical protein